MKQYYLARIDPAMPRNPLDQCKISSMNIHLIASIVSAILFLIGIAWYVVDVYHGRVRVAIVSVAMLTLINISQLGSLIAKELWYIVPVTIVAGIMNVLVILFGIKNANYQLKKLDIVVFIGALMGLVVWYVTGNAAYNIYILTVIMLVSVIPMVQKTFKDPTSETATPWRINLISTIVFMFTITSPAPEAWLVQARALVLAGLMNVAIQVRGADKNSKTGEPKLASK